MNNQDRCLHLIKEAISDFKLDLSGLTIYTEAATGYPGLTPIIALAANAQSVIAVARSSHYGSEDEAIGNVEIIAHKIGAQHRIIFSRNRLKHIEKADIITNTGFVRPINAEMVALMKPTAVVPLMVETWEHRPEDVDLIACAEKGILVLGTNEIGRRLNIFQYVGELVIKLLHELDIEIANSLFAIIGNDHFGTHALLALRNAQAGPTMYVTPGDHNTLMRNADAIIVAEDRPTTMLFSDDSPITAGELKELAPFTTVVQIKGMIDRAALTRAGIPFIPREDRGPLHMGFTLDHLGPKPGIRLRTAGLKVGEAMARARIEGMSVETAKGFALKSSPAMDFV